MRCAIDAALYAARRLLGTLRMARCFRRTLFAQEQMSLHVYEAFVYALFLRSRNPIAEWQRILWSRNVWSVVAWRSRVRVIGPNADLTLSVAGALLSIRMATHFAQREVFTGPLKIARMAGFVLPIPAITGGSSLRASNWPSRAQGAKS
jgi:hypothetical protein